MEPTLRHGDVVFVDPRAYLAGDPRPGDVVLAGHPFKESVRLVKRVHAVDPETGRLELRGDSPGASSDSRTLGRVPRGKVLGRVTSRKTS